MNISDEDKRREEFRSFLFSLAKSQDYLQEKSNRYKTYIQLEKIYHTDGTSDFRHFYSDIFSVLALIKNDSSLGDIDILGQNLALIRKNYQPKNSDESGNLIDISDSIRKLYDHVNLDIARIAYSENQNRKDLGEDSLEETKAKLKEIEKGLSVARNEITNDVDNVKNKLKASQREYIAILGIFSAVVLAFTASITFSTSVLENMHKTSIYRTLFVCLVIAFVLINVIYLMFKYIEKIVNGASEHMQLKEQAPIFIANAILVIIMLAILFFWHEGAVESRNNRINSSCSSQTNIIEITTNNDSKYNITTSSN